MTTLPKPYNPRFSAGPCSKFPGYDISKLTPPGYLGRTQRSDFGKQKIKDILDKTRNVLSIPDDYQILAVSGSDTGAFESALWNLAGEKPITVWDWGPFASKWRHDIVEELQVEDVSVVTIPIDKPPTKKDIKYPETGDLVFVWCVTAKGFHVLDGDWIPDDRDGLTFCDATSIAFAQPLPWSKLDVTTYSFQKVLGGEAGIGILVLSPRAMKRLNRFTPQNRPIPTIYRIKNNAELLDGKLINTTSFMSWLDYEMSMDWLVSLGGVEKAYHKCLENKKTIQDFVNQNSDWISNLIPETNLISPTVTCLLFKGIEKGKDDTKMEQMFQFFEDNHIGYDFKNYPTAPLGLRIWTGPTINSEDISRLLNWIHQYYHAILKH